MKIAFIGGVKFSYELLETILKNGWKISVVFSYCDSKKKLYSDYTDMEEITSKYKVLHKKVCNINDSENVELLKKISPDLILVMGWSQLLKSEIINIPRLGVIGSHPTELPKYRGRAPIPWTILKGLRESALTFFYIQEGVDDGDILDQKKFSVTEYDDATTIYDKVTQIGKKMLLENLLFIKEGKQNRIKQDPSKFIENWPKRTPDDGRIDWSKPNWEIVRLIRATTHPYPGAFTFFNNSKLKIWNAVCIDEVSKGIGKIMSVDKDVKVGTGKGIVVINRATVGDDVEKPASLLFSFNDINKILGNSNG